MAIAQRSWKAKPGILSSLDGQLQSLATPAASRIMAAADDVLICRKFGEAERTPFLRQVRRNECGLACLAMVAGYHGIDVCQSRLRRLCSLSIDGVTLRTLMTAAAQLGLETRALGGEVAGLHQIPLPAILHWKGVHFVVLAEVRRRSSSRCFHIFDPARGKRMMDDAELSRGFTGAVLALGRSPRLSEPPIARAFRGLG